MTPVPLQLGELHAIENRLDRQPPDTDPDTRVLLAEVWRLRSVLDDWGARLMLDGKLGRSDCRRALGLADPSVVQL